MYPFPAALPLRLDAGRNLVPIVIASAPCGREDLLVRGVCKARRVGRGTLTSHLNIVAFICVASGARPASWLSFCPKTHCVFREVVVAIGSFPPARDCQTVVVSVVSVFKAGEVDRSEYCPSSQTEQASRLTSIGL